MITDSHSDSAQQLIDPDAQINISLKRMLKRMEAHYFGDIYQIDIDVLNIEK